MKPIVPRISEVHLWRGSAEQRALRGPGRVGQFSYFDKQLDRPAWSNKRVLDFGGNAGSLLRDSSGKIAEANYYCVDVLEEALEAGRTRFPSAQFFRFDRYNCSFNPSGLKELALPEFGVRFDVIVAYSVFTHTTIEDLRDLVRQLEHQLAPGGVLAFTFIDPHFESWPERYPGTNLRWHLEKTREANEHFDVECAINVTAGASWCSVVNGSEVFRESNGCWSDSAQSCLTYETYFTTALISKLFNHAIIRNPVNGEMQHCCLIHRDA